MNDHKLVPVEPNLDMDKAGENALREHCSNYRSKHAWIGGHLASYKAMLEAAPTNLPDPFSLPEINAILAVDHCPRAQNLIQTALYTGLRIEELAALTWASVDFNAGKLYVTHAAQLSIGKSDLKAPKTPTSTRAVDLLPKALEALKRQQAVTRFHGERFFTRWASYAPITRYKQMRRRWNTIIEKSGVRRRPMKHCRHTYASHMLSSGHNPLYVAGQLGHSGTALLDVYARWVDCWKEQERKYGT